MKMLLTTFALLASLGVAHAAGPVTAREWIQACVDKAALKQIACFTYVRGVADGLTLWVHGDEENAPVCIPDTVTSAQLVAVGQKFFKDSPKDQHLVASVFLGFAFLDSWPCDLPDGQGKYRRKL